MLTVSDVQALIVITLGDAFVLNRRVRQQLAALATGDVDTSDDGLTNPLEAGYLHALRSDDA
jgi:hypothetical protein